MTDQDYEQEYCACARCNRKTHVEEGYDCDGVFYCDDCDPLTESQQDELKFFCDNARHLVCKPFSVENLHVMAAILGINRCWFHVDHYDVPKRRVAEIAARCEIVASTEIVRIARNK